MTFLYLFYEFFKIGLFAVGGGPATIPFCTTLPRAITAGSIRNSLRI